MYITLESGVEDLEKNISLARCMGLQKVKSEMKIRLVVSIMIRALLVEKEDITSLVLMLSYGTNVLDEEIKKPFSGLSHLLYEYEIII